MRTGNSASNSSLCAAICLFTSLLIALAPRPAHAQGPIVSGQTVTGAILSGGATTTWTFSANAGDAFVVSIGELSQSGALSPRIRVYDPSATLIASSAGLVAAALNSSAATTGTYSIVVDDAAGLTASGTYQLTLALSGHAVTVPGGDEGGPMTNGVRHTGTISVGELDVWTISAVAGDEIVVRIGESTIGSPLTPRMLLYSPTGTLLAAANGASATELSATAPVTGDCMLVISDFSSGFSGSGNYEMTLARSGAAVTTLADDEGGPLTNGAAHTGTLEVGDLDLWTVTANVGDAIVARMGETTAASPLSPELRLYSPTGTLVDVASGVSACEVAANATVAGTYLVVASDFSIGFAGSGGYRLTLAHTGAPVTVSAGDEGGPLTNGLMHTGTITMGDLDLWTVSLVAGDAFVLRAGETVPASALSPQLRIFTPAGVQLGIGSGTAAIEISGVATVTGEYLVIASDFSTGYAGTGAYRLTLARTGAPVSVSAGDEGGPMTNGLQHGGTLDVGDLDAWTVSANAGDALIVRMGESTAGEPLSPELRIYSPVGALLQSGASAAATEVVATAPVTGDYLVVVSDFSTGFAGSGNYLLNVARSGAAFVTSAGDQGGPLLPGLSFGDLPVGDLDLWTLSANSGDPMVAVMEEIVIGSTLSPELRLYSPAGVLLKSAAGVSRAQVNAVAPVTGTYLLVASDFSSGYAGSGAYRITPYYTTDAGGAPKAFALAFARPSPNPSAGRTSLRYSLAAEGSAALEMFDAQGRLVRTLLSERSKPAGEYAVEWDGRDARGATLRPGVYLARLTAGGRDLLQKVLITR